LDVLRGFFFAYFLMNLGSCQMASTRVFTASGDKSSGDGVSLCTDSGKRLLIEHGSVVGRIKSCGAVRISLVSFCGVSLVI
jgi:hypothetical protein